MYVDIYTTLTVLALTGSSIYIYDISRLMGSSTVIENGGRVRKVKMYRIRGSETNKNTVFLEIKMERDSFNMYINQQDAQNSWD